MVLSVMIIFCFVIMFFILIKTIRENSIPNRVKRNFIISIIIALVMLIADGLSMLKAGDYIKISVGAHYAVQIIYFISASITCYFVFLLMDCIGDKPLIKKRRTRLLLTIPIYVYSLFVLTSIWSGLIFTIDKTTNEYLRGPLNFFQFLFCYSYLFSALGLSIYKYIREKADPNRELYFTSIVFCLMPTLGGVFQFAFSILAEVDVPLISAGLALSTVIIFIEIVQKQVSLDGLTGLFSRKAFYNYLYSINKTNITHLYVYLLDLNKFKEINDNFGHVEGDNALILFAHTLRTFTSKKKGVAARIGGDEFAIAVELAKTTPEEYLDLLIEDLNQINDGKLQYNLSASIGFALFEENDTIKELIAKADKEMYKQKLKQR